MPSDEVLFQYPGYLRVGGAQISQKIGSIILNKFLITLNYIWLLQRAALLMLNGLYKD